MSGTYTEEELSGLSETERAALTGTDEDDDALNDIIGDDPEGDGDGEGDDDDSSSDTSGDDNTDNADDKGNDDDTTGDVLTDKDADGNETASDVSDEFNLDDVPAVSFVPKLSGEILPVYQAEIDKVVASRQADIDALDARLDEGELSQAEYRSQLRAIENDIRAETRRLEAASQNAEMGGQMWQAEQKTFFKENPNYSSEANGVLWGTLNQEVLRLANDPKTASLSGIQILYMAKHNVEKAFKAMFPGAKDQIAKPNSGKKTVISPKPSAKRPDHQTLRDVPPADAADVGQDKFAHLDKLSGMALEAAIARMSPEEQDAYLKGA